MSCHNCNCDRCKITHLVAENNKLLEALAKARDELRRVNQEVEQLRAAIRWPQ